MLKASDFNLLEIFAGHTTRCEDVDTNNCIKFICNTAFSDVIDPCRNVKFPGALVVSLSRRHVPMLKGRSAIHMAYKNTDVIPWIHPTERQMPPFQFHETPQQHHKEVFPLRFDMKSDIDTVNIDFGEEDKLFLVISPLNILLSQIDFGGNDGLFTISPF